ncbi:UNVERIFIED_ORG: hypothetical protein M2348_000089 [Sphingomonas sp. R1F5B]
MTTDVPTADWPSLFRELPIAIEQLRFHDAHCSREAALLLDGGLFALKHLDPARVWAELVPVIGMLAIEANDHRTQALPKQTLAFLDKIEGAFSEWLETQSPFL